ncbi:IS4 family transposase, partial [Thermus thalpophilus]
MEQLTPLINALKRYWKADLRRLTFLAALVMALVTARTTSGPRLALSLGSIASPDPRSAYRRFQRFLAWPGLDGEGYARFIFALLRPQGLLLVMDRTEWELGKSKVNLLMLAFLYQGLAVPLFWSFLPHDGNSSTPERIALMERALAFLRAHFPHLRVEGFLADREFIGEAWFRYLEEKGIPRCIRIKANTRMWRLGSGPRAWELFASLKVGESRVPRRRYWVYGRRMWVVGLRLGVREWLIVATDLDPHRVLEVYGLRWGIERLFGALKGRGFDLEATHVTRGERLSRLLVPLSLAFVWAFRTGLVLHRVRPVRPKKHGR